MANNNIFNREGVQCPICFGYLDFLAITDNPPMDGVGGNVIFCELCASLVVAVKLEPGKYTLRPMTQPEKEAMRRDPTAPLMRAFQERKAFELGGSD